MHLDREVQDGPLWHRHLYDVQDVNDVNSVASHNQGYASSHQVSDVVVDLSFAALCAKFPENQHDLHFGEGLWDCRTVLEGNDVTYTLH